MIHVTEKHLLLLFLINIIKFFLNINYCFSLASSSPLAASALATSRSNQYSLLTLALVSMYSWTLRWTFLLKLTSLNSRRVNLYQSNLSTISSKQKLLLNMKPCSCGQAFRMVSTIHGLIFPVP